MSSVPNTDTPEEIDRRIILYVKKYIPHTEKRPTVLSNKPPIRYVRWELTKEQAIKMRDDINAQLKLDRPGTITVEAKGDLRI